jgi:hypothetical protein
MWAISIICRSKQSPILRKSCHRDEDSCKCTISRWKRINIPPERKNVNFLCWKINIIGDILFTSSDIGISIDKSLCSRLQMKIVHFVSLVCAKSKISAPQIFLCSEFSKKVKKKILTSLFLSSTNIYQMYVCHFQAFWKVSKKVTKSYQNFRRAFRYKMDVCY